MTKLQEIKNLIEKIKSEEIKKTPANSSERERERKIFLGWKLLSKKLKIKEVK